MGGRTIKMLAEREIKDSLGDARFYERMPEFLPLRAKMAALHEDLIRPKGCTGCAKNRVYRSLGSSYLRTVAAIRDRPDAVARLREYFGADELRATILDPDTQQPKTIKL